MSDGLTSARLALTPFSPALIEELHALFLDPGLARYLLDGERLPRSWVASVIEDSARDFADGRLGLWAALQLGTGECVGFCGFRDFFEPPQHQLIYGLPERTWGRGYGREMARAAVEAAFAAGASEIRASVDAPNGASIRLLDDLGFSRRGEEAGPQWPLIHFALAAGSSSPADASAPGAE